MGEVLRWCGVVAHKILETAQVLGLLWDSGWSIFGFDEKRPDVWLSSAHKARSYNQFSLIALIRMHSKTTYLGLPQLSEAYSIMHYYKQHYYYTTTRLAVNKMTRLKNNG